MEIKVDNTIYSREAIAAALYKFSGDNYVSQCIDEENRSFTIIEIAAKNGLDKDNLKREFMNVLNDYQVRCDLENRFGSIRDQIVEEAFKPITKRNG